MKDALKPSELKEEILKVLERPRDVAASAGYTRRDPIAREAARAGRGRPSAAPARRSGCRP
jgi:hypothetical protein